VNLIDGEKIESDARADDVGDRIHRADFVKVGPFRLARRVPALRPRRAFWKTADAFVSHAPDRSVVNQIENVMEMAVARVRAIRDYAEFRSRDAAAGHLLHLEARACVQTAQRVEQVSAEAPASIQSADRHVAADSGKRVR